MCPASQVWTILLFPGGTLCSSEPIRLDEVLDMFVCAGGGMVEVQSMT